MSLTPRRLRRASWYTHRAYSDVVTMLNILGQYDISKIVKISYEPSYTLEAITKKPWEDAAPEGQKEIDKARARGYRWKADRKKWIKVVKKSQVKEEKSHGEFPVRDITEVMKIIIIR